MPERQAYFPPGVRPMRDRDAEFNLTRHTNFEVEFPVVTRQTWYNPMPYLYNAFNYIWINPLSKVKEYFDKRRAERPPILYMHKNYRHVPEIWECAVDDVICICEAEDQFIRQRIVEGEIVDLYKERLMKCKTQADATPEQPYTTDRACAQEYLDWENMKDNWSIKYGDLGKWSTARKALNKQKNRFIEERYFARTGEKRN